MKKAGKQTFIASVEDGFIGRTAQVAGRLKRKGCEISEILELTGVITGKVSGQTDLESLRVKGIASIEKQRTVRKKRP